MQRNTWHVAGELHKLELILNVLMSGYSVLYLDPDAIVFRNPMLHLLSLKVCSPLLISPLRPLSRMQSFAANMVISSPIDQPKHLQRVSRTLVTSSASITCSLSSRTTYTHRSCHKLLLGLPGGLVKVVVLQI